MCNTLSIREGAPATPTIIGVGRKGAGSDRKRARLARLFKYTLGVIRMVETTFRNNAGWGVMGSRRAPFKCTIDKSEFIKKMTKEK